MVQRIVYFMVGLAVLLSSCSQATIQPTPTANPTGVLTPYQSITPSLVQPTSTIRITIPVTPTPTATPFLYSVKGNDTMLSIAYQFGISLQELQAANPTVDPHYMGEGLKLVIPTNPETQVDAATPTPMPINTGAAMCYPAGDGGVMCMVGLKNNLESDLENLSVWIGLVNRQGEVITSQVTYAPLNILRQGDTMPMMAYFAPPLPDEYQAQSELLSALPIADDDTRYLNLRQDVTKTDISPDGEQAEVIGKVIGAQGIPTLSQLWVLAVAYDGEGHIVGERKWKSGGENNFDITVYSLGGKIEKVDVLVEARP